MSRRDSNRRARWVVSSAAILTVVSYFVPYGFYVVYPMMLLSTYAHEMGHGITALIVGGRFEQFVMFSDGSGAAHTLSQGRVPRASIAAGGLGGPAVLAAAMFAAAARARSARIGLWVLAGGVFASMLLVVRNLFGWGYLAALVAVVALIAMRGKPLVVQSTLAFIAVQLAASVFSRSDYLFTAVANTASGPMPSDVAQMADALLLPYWFWGAVCGAFSLLVLAVGLRVFWRNTS